MVGLISMFSRYSARACLTEAAQAVQRSGFPAEMVRTWRGSDQPWVHPNAAVAVDRDGSPVGYVAHLHPASARRLGIPATTAIACIDVRALMAAGRQEPVFAALPTFPLLPVDVALLVPEAVQVAAMAIRFLVDVPA